MTVSAPATRLADVARVLQATVRDEWDSGGAAGLAARWMAVIWGTPTPATTRVVQIEPGPTPTLTASTPASMRACAPSVVATLPPMMSMPSNVGSP